MATPKDSALTGSDSYQKFTVLDEQIEVYLRITKIDEETGKPVLLPGTAFQIYYLDDDGNYRLENGAPKLVRMTDTINGHLTKNITTFYTNEEGVLTLPENCRWVSIASWKPPHPTDSITSGWMRKVTMSILPLPPTAFIRRPAIRTKTAWTRW